MKKILKFSGVLFGLALLGVIVLILLMPWMDRWGATDAEIAASFTGDELVPSPRITYTRAVSINAAPEDIYPWIVQLGAEKGGMYSYEWFETNILRCELINADRIHPEWQNLKVGDPMKMCPGTSGPPPYEIAILKPNQAIIMGHKENGDWIEIWQFLLVPHADGTTRLIVRSRNAAQGVFWDIIRPGEFIMGRGMMLGIKERAERLAAETVTTPSVPEASAGTQSISWADFGRTVSLSYDPALATQVQASTVPAVPMSNEILFSESHPAYIEFRFSGYQNGRAFELPVFPFEAQVMVFPTVGFTSFGDDSPIGFVNQKQALVSLLKTYLDPALCAQPLTGEFALPFLPWTNYKQTFCAQPQFVEFAGGRGVRYLTYYSQGPNPVLDYQVFYTFQGITEDEQFYVSALFPVETGIFPSEAPTCSACGEPASDPIQDWNTVLAEQLTRLNAQAPDQFAPSLDVLDQVIKSIDIH